MASYCSYTQHCLTRQWSRAKFALLVRFCIYLANVVHDSGPQSLKLFKGMTEQVKLLVLVTGKLLGTDKMELYGFIAGFRH